MNEAKGRGVKSSAPGKAKAISWIGRGVPALNRGGLGPWNSPAAMLRSVLYRLFYILVALLFSSCFDAFWHDLNSMSFPNLPTKIHQDPSKINAQMLSNVDFMV